MTVSYQSKVASSSHAGFTKLLFLWRGSLYQVLYRELIIFMIAFGTLSAIYRNVFNERQKEDFERMVSYCDAFITQLPLSFILGFYVTYVAKRWWKQYLAIPWPDKAMHIISLYIDGNDEQGRLIRRSLMRYLILTLIMVLRSISSSVKKRFPTLDHVVESGFMTEDEMEIFQSLPHIEFNTYWIPCTWFTHLLKEARKANRIDDPQGMKLIMEEFNDFRSKCGLLWSYDWISIPLAYTQVVTIATYSFYLAAIVGRQYVKGSDSQLQTELDVYVPVFTIVELLFFLGLLKVAEQLINPFGDDEEDFELNWIIDRHTKVAFLAVDFLTRLTPPLVKDIYFDEFDLTLPYTSASAPYKIKTHRGSVHDMAVPEDQQMMYLPEIMEEDKDPDQLRSRGPSIRSNKSDSKFNLQNEKTNEAFDIMHVQPRRHSSIKGLNGVYVNRDSFTNRSKRTFRPLIKRKSCDANTGYNQPVILMSVTRRLSSTNSVKWNSFKSKTTTIEDGRTDSIDPLSYTLTLPTPNDQQQIKRQRLPSSVTTTVIEKAVNVDVARLDPSNSQIGNEGYDNAALNRDEQL
ncbi:bestrophin-4-like [Daktulosphaira vitifoliae]|uniref:bestrophin-4-like n=1 Tax=Daktulosphaira vitifoliae TaxID=58002 RepID=UPI0021AB0088|nr:bestrophin-4-like [Daktulosphaira vitifoliae]